MGNLVALTPPGGAEWLIVLALFVLLFGAKKLPELGSSVGKSIKNFKKGIEEGQDDASDADVHAADEVGDTAPGTPRDT